LEHSVGFRLFTLDDPPQAMPEAIAVSVSVPNPDQARS
jgi:hypothetical protein